MARHINTGRKGESIAVQYLKSQGFRILETNWRNGHDEIDIIALDENELVIVEVKTLSSEYFGYPEEAVNKKKQNFLIRATQAYVDQNEIDLEIRYDIVSIYLKEQSHKIYHIKDAFTPGL